MSTHDALFRQCISIWSANVQEALSAPWPKFELVTVLDLLPDHLKGEYTRIC